jgi:hypothetical protein
VTAQPDLLWTRPEWLAEATAWVRERVEVAGEIEQPHVQWWSTVLRVPTADGVVWFKACHPSHGFEPALTLELARLRPERIIEVLAVDLERGWMLTGDAGTRLREQLASADDVARWEEVLAAYAGLQLEAVDHVERLLELGVPHDGLAQLPARFRHVLGDHELLLVDREDGLDAGQHERLVASVPDVERLCAELAAAGIPETIQHDDLHDGNVFVRDGHYLFFDWGDSCVSHPFHSLVVTMRQLVHRLELPPGGPDILRLRDAYLEPFVRFAPRSELVEAAELAHDTGTASRSLSWNRFIRAREPEFRFDDEDAVPYGLKRLLDLGPLGSWS